MSIDGPIESFSPFHNINCPKGFLYFNKQVGGAGMGTNRTSASGVVVVMLCLFCTGRAEDQRSAHLPVLRRSLASAQNPPQVHRSLRLLPR